MPILLTGLVLFLGVHSLALIAPGIRTRVTARVGEGPWKGLFALVAVAGLVLIGAGVVAARSTAVVLFTPPAFARYVAIALMLPVFPLAFASVLPGTISRRLGHPLLAATKAWALAHLIANGTLADAILFAAFLAWAVVERISLQRRRPRPLPTAPASRYNDLIAVAAGLALYAAMLGGLHLRLIGVSPLP